MKIANILTEVIKDHERGKKWTLSAYAELKLLIPPDNTMGYLIPKDRMILSEEIFKPSPGTGEKLFELLRDAETIEYTGVSQYEASSYQSADGKIEVYLDRKKLKNFSKYAELLAVSESTPVYILEDSVIAGVVLPIKVRK